jgi:hypothetical protein
MAREFVDALQANRSTFLLISCQRRSVASMSGQNFIFSIEL